MTMTISFDKKLVTTIKTGSDRELVTMKTGSDEELVTM